MDDASGDSWSFAHVAGRRPAADSPSPLAPTMWGRVSPPPQGMMDEDEVQIPTERPGSTDSSARGETLLAKQRRLGTQLRKWRALLQRNPHDPLAHFWREQVASLEARLACAQPLGNKRVRDARDCPGDEMEDSACSLPKRVALQGLPLLPTQTNRAEPPFGAASALF
jgi:hypothetical protein